MKSARLWLPQIASSYAANQTLAFVVEHLYLAVQLAALANFQLATRNLPVNHTGRLNNE